MIFLTNQAVRADENTTTDFWTVLYAGGSSKLLVVSSDYSAKTTGFRMVFLFNSLVGRLFTFREANGDSAPQKPNGAVGNFGRTLCDAFTLRFWICPAERVGTPSPSSRTSLMTNDDICDTSLGRDA